jgi:hypothetical protein
MIERLASFLFQKLGYVGVSSVAVIRTGHRFSVQTKVDCTSMKPFDQVEI